MMIFGFHLQDQMDLAREGISEVHDLDDAKHEIDTTKNLKF